MIRVDGKAAVYGEVWFDEQPPRDARVDIVLYRDRGAPIPNARQVPRLTLITDLTADADAIIDRFNGDCRYKIRRAQEKDGVRAGFITDPESSLEPFSNFYDAFARQKSLPPCDRAWLAAASRAGHLVLSAAYADSGDALVWHAYVRTGCTARLQYTVSLFRDKDTRLRSLIGRTNRWLHWKDMLSFKAMDTRRYDWGGIFLDESIPEQAGINEFKRSFGGSREQHYDCTVPLTLKGHIYLPLRDFWRYWSAPQPAVA